MNPESISINHKKQFEALSTYLRELRRNENLTQREIGEEIGLHWNTISNIETQHNFTLSTLFKLCDYYELSPSELFSIID